MLFVCPMCARPSGTVGVPLVPFGVVNQMGCTSCMRVYEVTVSLREVGRLDDPRQRLLPGRDGEDDIVGPQVPDPERA